MQHDIFLYLCFLGTTCLLAYVKGTANGDLRLVDGRRYYGRVEIYYHGYWSTVCDYSWDLADAQVVCRQLGLGPAVSAYDADYFGRGVGPTFLNGVWCKGYEERLDQCVSGRLQAHDCSNMVDAGVKCSRKPLSGAAIAGIISAVLFVIACCPLCCVIGVYKQNLTPRNRRSNPTEMFSSGSNNLGGEQTTSTTPQPMTCGPQTSTNNTGLPSYNEAVSNPAYNSHPVIVTSSIAPQPSPQETAMHANSAVTYSYQIPPNTAFPDIYPPSVVHPPPNANPTTNENFQLQNLSHQVLQNNDPVYPSNYISSTYAPSMP